MTRIPEESIEAVRSETNLVQLIGEYVQLTKRGKNWFGLCPFHGENTPSFSVSEDKQLFHCFGCGASGNAITFLMDIENISFTEAIVKLAERTSIEIDVPIHDGATVSRTKQYKEMFDAHELAANFYNHLLLNTVEGEKALQYLEQRGFTRELIEKYGIGWSLEERDALTTVLQRENFDLKEMERAGLCIMSHDGASYFDRFRGRIMFPLHDDNGNTIGFSGRVLSKDSDQVKYLNSPETPIFEKSQLLYNFHRARLNVRKSGKVILFEGFMDTIAAERASIENSVAVMGTALSESHLQKIKRIAQQLVICCDGDDAGWEAAKRFAAMAVQAGIDVQVATLPANMDPDDYISTYGGQAFREKILDNSHTYMSFIMTYAKRGKTLTNDNDVLQFIHEVLEELVTRQSPIERDLVFRQLSNETAISIDALQQQFMKLEGKSKKRLREQQLPVEQMHVIEPTTTRNMSATQRAERLLLSHLLNDYALFQTVREEHSHLFIQDEYAALFVRLASFYEQYEVPNFHRFAEMLEDRELRKIVMEVAMLDRDHEFIEQEIADCIQHLQKQRIELLIQDKSHLLKEADRNKEYERAMELAKEIIQLRNSL